jgi:thiol-disulfide isomerase/thioredoxin
MKTSIVWHCGAIAAAVLILSTAAAEVRTWTSADGKFTVQAEMLSVEDGSVSLRKADGTEINVPLTKLSKADRQFAAGRASRTPALVPVTGIDRSAKTESREQKLPASKTTPTTAALTTVREIAETFYADLRTTERASAAAALTAEAQKLALDKKSVLTSLPSPDQGAAALKVGKPKIKGTQAEVPVQVRVDGNNQKTLLHLRSEGDTWQVFALSVVLGKEEQTINFETPRPAAEKQDPLAALIGQKMELSGVTLDGQQLNMDKYKGKVVLVDFWATWCGPCRAEIPNILANWQRFHDAGFEVIAISVDQDLKELSEFVAAERPPWTVIADRHPINRNSMGQKYGITGIPAFVLIGADGKVATVHCRGERLGQALAKLLPANKTASR